MDPFSARGTGGTGPRFGVLLCGTRRRRLPRSSPITARPMSCRRLSPISARKPRGAISNSLLPISVIRIRAGLISGRAIGRGSSVKSLSVETSSSRPGLPAFACAMRAPQRLSCNITAAGLRARAGPAGDAPMLVTRRTNVLPPQR